MIQFKTSESTKTRREVVLPAKYRPVVSESNFSEQVFHSRSRSSQLGGWIKTVGALLLRLELGRWPRRLNSPAAGALRCGSSQVRVFAGACPEETGIGPGGPGDATVDPREDANDRVFIPKSSMLHCLHIGTRSFKTE